MNEKSEDTPEEYAEKLQDISKLIINSGVKAARQPLDINFRFLLGDPEYGQRRFTVECTPPGCKPTTMLSILINEDEALQLYYLGVPVYEKRRQELQEMKDRAGGPQFVQR